MSNLTLATLFGCRNGIKNVSSQTMFNYTDKRQSLSGRIYIGSEYHIKSISKGPQLSSSDFEVNRILQSRKKFTETKNKWIQYKKDNFISDDEDVIITHQGTILFPT